MLKTQVVKKRKKENRLYTHYGFYKWQNVLVDIIKISLGIFLYHICFLLYFKIFSIKYIFFNIDSLHNIYYDFIFRYFSLFKVTLLFELIHILFLTPYLIMFWYIFYAYKGFKKSQLQQKMSNLGLESYILRKKEYGYLLVIANAENIDSSGYYTSIEEAASILKGNEFKITIMNGQGDLVIESTKTLDAVELKKHLTSL